MKNVLFLINRHSYILTPQTEVKLLVLMATHLEYF